MNAYSRFGDFDMLTAAREIGVEAIMESRDN